VRTATLSAIMDVEQDENGLATQYYHPYPKDLEVCAFDEGDTT